MYIVYNYSDVYYRYVERMCIYNMKKSDKEILMGLESMYSSFAEFAVNTFVLCNGVINPIFRATNISFGPRSGETDLRKSISMGQQIFSRIDINIYNIFLHGIRIKATLPSQIKAIILNNVIHELSHCDQYIDYLNPDKYYIGYIENVNRIWVNELIKVNWSTLSTLDDIDYDTAITCCPPIKNPPASWPEPVYRSVLNAGMKISMCLNKILNTDLSGLFRSCKDIDLEYIDSFGTQYNCPMVRDWEWQDINKITLTLQKPVDSCSNYMYMIKSSNSEGDPVTISISSIIDKPNMVFQ